MPELQQTPALASTRASAGSEASPAWPDRREPRVTMVCAYVLIQTEIGTAGRVAHTAGDIDGVQQAEEIAGPYDVIARIHAPDLDALAKLVVARIQAVAGVTRTLICPMLRETPHDLLQPAQA